MHIQYSNKSLPITIRTTKIQAKANVENIDRFTNNQIHNSDLTKKRMLGKQQ